MKIYNMQVSVAVGVLVMCLAPCMAHAQFGGYGSNPAQAMFIPAGFDISSLGGQGDLFPRFNQEQTPVGVYGVKPVGRMDDGTPVYAQMPVYDEVDGAFVVTIWPPGLNPNFPGMPRKVRVPPKGRKRKAFIRKLEAEFEQAYKDQRMYQAWRNTSGAALAENYEVSAREAEYRAKMQSIRDKEHQRQLDLSDQRFYHMNQNQLQHYRDGWQPVVQPVGGLQYGTPDLMVAPNGNDVYWVW